MMKTLYRTVFLLFISVCYMAHPAEAIVYIDITAPGMRQIPIAVPYLDTLPRTFENDLVGRKLAEVLSNDLTFHGFFSVLDPMTYGGRANADWGRYRLDFLVTGSVTANGDTISVDWRLLEMPSQKVLEQRNYTGKSGDYRRMAHEFCDVIIKAITGEHGVSLSKIAFVGKNGAFKDVFIADFDGYGPVAVTSDKSATLSPRFSPDGNRIAYTSYRSGKPHLYIKDLRSGKVTKIAGHPGINISPAWHPNGDRLAVSLSKDGQPDIYVIDLQGRVLEKLTGGIGMKVSPTWSPDGTRIAYVSDQSGSPQIYVMNLATRSSKRITHSGDYNTDPQWSPKGDRIAYVSRIGGRFQIMTISPDGGALTQLTSSGSNENPVWSPDGRLILFTSNRFGPKSLFVMLANGDAQRILMRHNGPVSTPSWGPNRSQAQ
ncbi:MAG: Tol-Pal system beta propeller repeat protein TolB [Deltaproteobacteria bacterium]